MAGCDFSDKEFEDNIPAAIRGNSLTEARLDDALTRVLRVRFRLGDFDPFNLVPYSQISPNVINSAGHRAVAALEHHGVVNGVVTQNVDLLHTKAGSRTVIDLHGTYAQVICLSCGESMSRAELAEKLDALNPGFTEQIEAIGGLAVAPDADAVIADTASFRYLDCASCGGMLKPDIVYFGESVPKDIVQQAISLVEDAGALLVAGSSLTVFSGNRFVRHAAARGIPVAIVNRGPTRGDELATVKVQAGCSELLTLLAEELCPASVR